MKRLLCILVLLAASTVAGRPASAATITADLLEPGTDDVLHGTIRVSVQIGGLADGEHVSEVRFLAGSLAIGTDGDGDVLTTGPDCVPSCTAHGIFQVDWTVPSDYPKGDVTVHAQADVCAVTCATRGFSWSGFTAFPQLRPEAVWPADHAEVPPVFPVVTRFTDPQRSNLEYALAPVAFQQPSAADEAPMTATAPQGPKGLPAANQLTDGVDVSTGGRMSCAPTAAASSLSWFATNGWPDARPEGITMRDLTRNIGKRAGTSDGGTSQEGLTKALKGYVRNQNLPFEVKHEPDPSLTQIRTEFARGQDVLISYWWTQNGAPVAHAMAVDRIDAKADGSVDITVMDPNGGVPSTLTARDDPNGVPPGSWGRITSTYSGTNGRIFDMIHVSPPDGTAFAPISPGLLPVYVLPDGLHTALVDATGFPPGDYLLRTTGSDFFGNRMSEYTMITIGEAS